MFKTFYGKYQYIHITFKFNPCRYKKADLRSDAIPTLFNFPQEKEHVGGEGGAEEVYRLQAKSITFTFIEPTVALLVFVFVTYCSKNLSLTQ